MLGLSNTALGVTLASQGNDAFLSMLRSVSAWAEVLAAIGAFGALGMAAAGIAFLFWLARSMANLRTLPVPDDRQQSSCAAVPLFVLFPVLAVAFFIVLRAYPYSTASQVVLFAAASASLVIPLMVIRGLWVASSIHTAAESVPPVWDGVLVWWTAYLTAWIATGLSVAVPGESWNDFAEAMVGSIAGGLLEIVSATALALAAVFIIRIMFRVNAMQDALAGTLPQSTARSERREVGTVQRTAAQWQCESCEVMNPTAMRFCQNCARERR